MAKADECYIHYAYDTTYEEEASLFNFLDVRSKEVVPHFGYINKYINPVKECAKVLQGTAWTRVDYYYWNYKTHTGAHKPVGKHTRSAPNCRQRRARCRSFSSSVQHKCLAPGAASLPQLLTDLCRYNSRR